MGAYAIADLHGCLDIWQQVQKYCKNSDRIYVLGDCIDRGANSLQTLKSVLGDARTTLICGNHEDMMAQTVIDYYDGECEYGYPWFYNDGYHTFHQWVDDGYKKEWASVLRALPLWAKYTNQNGENIILNHSGVVPKAGYDYGSLTRKPLLWDRDNLRATRWHRDENEYVIHGHTPIQLMQKDAEPGALWYCEGHKCNIDYGSCWTGISCLLDLDTWEEHIFYGKV